MEPGDILIYKDLFDIDHEVEFIQVHEEGFTVLVKHEERGNIWLRPTQLQETGRKAEKKKLQQETRKKTTWTIGDPIPEHLIKTKGGKKK